ncbi:MAG: hypothetical protein D6681_07300, partial [Calditrichaeota bacterium]
PVDAQILKEIRNRERPYRFQVDTLEEGYTRLVLTTDLSHYRRVFYFRENKLISPGHYFARRWHQETTRYFRFLISDPRDFNAFAAEALDQFVDSLLILLEVSPEARERLAREKIIYLLCHTTGEMENITGMAARGIYLVAWDQVVSTFNCHRHEVAHLLMNYKLEHLSLYTHPFFLEGFACAVGGRGGKSAAVIRQIGAFLQQSGFLTYERLLDINRFQEVDPTLSYPLSAIYNWFLLHHLGVESYLRLYRSHGGDTPSLNNIPRNGSRLPPPEAFEAFLQKHEAFSTVAFPSLWPDFPPLMEAHWGSVWEDERWYYFRLRGSVRMIPSRPVGKAFRSREFHEIFPDVPYSGERYYLQVSPEEVKLYDFYTMALIAFYSNGLSPTRQAIREEDGYFRFALPRKLFAEPLPQMSIAQ